MKRVALVVLDSLGVGALPDAESYGDQGANTLGHILERYPEIKIPNLRRMGLFSIDGVSQIYKEMGTMDANYIMGAFGRLSEKSKGKDTITGHWEIGGLYTEIPFQTYPDGFPKPFMEAFEKAIGRETIGNYPASGTEIIEALGPAHEQTGKPIIYTSADSVFQIAANTEIISLKELYSICETARDLLVGDMACGRVIARPYIFENGKRTRTSDRKDYAVSPRGRTLLDAVKDSGKTVYAIGKINDIFNGQGVSTTIHTESNMDGIDKTIQALKLDFDGLIFTNLVDFDSKYGHRRDAVGYGKCLEAFDRRLPEILQTLKEEDILILCADHGNDPVHSGWDHTREYVPILIYGKEIKPGINLGTGASFADIGRTIADILEVEPTVIGESFLSKVKV